MRRTIARYAPAMTAEPAARISANAAATIVDGLQTQGLVVLDNVLPSLILDALGHRARQYPIDAFAVGGVGRDDRRLHESLRNDRIVWIDPDDDATRWYFAWIESLRIELNRTLFLGLFDYECHFAWYPAGSFYGRHLDAFRGRRSRRVSTVLYLNHKWTEDDGGSLMLYQQDEPEAGEAAAVRTVVPVHGRLVVFLSEDVPHEVQPAQRSRYSIAGWFRVASDFSGL